MSVHGFPTQRNRAVDLLDDEPASPAEELAAEDALALESEPEPELDAELQVLRKPAAELTAESEPAFTEPRTESASLETSFESVLPVDEPALVRSLD